MIICRKESISLISPLRNPWIVDMDSEVLNVVYVYQVCISETYTVSGEQLIFFKPLIPHL